MPGDPVTAVIVNYRTPDLVRRAVDSFRNFYPSVPLLLIDNGSPGEGADRILRIGREDGGPTRIVVNHRNRHHGPAMDQALRLLASPYVLFLDSDCSVTHGGFLERMVSALDPDPSFYAAGKKIMMNKRGFASVDPSGGIEYIRPILMLIRREHYLTLPPFVRHGAPCLRNFAAARERGLVLIDFPVEDFVDHTGRGTAGRYGYRLGLRGKVNHLLNKLGL